MHAVVRLLDEWEEAAVLVETLRLKPAFARVQEAARSDRATLTVVFYNLGAGIDESVERLQPRRLCLCVPPLTTNRPGRVHKFSVFRARPGVSYAPMATQGRH